MFRYEGARFLRLPARLVVGFLELLGSRLIAVTSAAGAIVARATFGALLLVFLPTLLVVRLGGWFGGRLGCRLGCRLAIVLVVQKIVMDREGT